MRNLERFFAPLGLSVALLISGCQAAHTAGQLPGDDGTGAATSTGTQEGTDKAESKVGDTAEKAEKNEKARNESANVQARAKPGSRPDLKVDPKPDPKPDTKTDPQGDANRTTKPATADPKATNSANQSTAAGFYEVLLAEMLGQQGDFAASYELLMRAAVMQGQEELFQRAGQAALQLGDGDRALQAAKAWQEAQPQSRDANKAVLQLLVAMNQIPQTQWHLKQELRLTSDEEMAENLHAVPLLYQRTPDKATAFAVAQAAMEDQLQPDSPWRGDALAALGRMQLQAGNVPVALNYLDQAHAANPKAGGVGFLALELVGHDPARVAAPLQAYAESEDAEPTFLLGYARLQIGQGQDGQALQTLTQLTEKKPDLPEAWLAKAALQAGQKDYAGGRASLEKFDDLLVQLPDSPIKQRAVDEAAILRAQMADLEGKHTEAEQWLSRVEDEEMALRAQLQRARILAEVGRMPQARNILQSVPAPTPEMQRLKALAEVQLLRDFEQFGDAYTVMGKLVQQHQGDVDLRYEYALLAERAGHVQEMEKQLRQILARKPDHMHALNALGYSLADRGVRLAEARRLISKALSMDPESAYIIDSLGWLEYRQGNIAQAHSLLDKAYRIEPDAEISAHLGEVLWKLGRQDEARKVWSEGLRQNAKNSVLRETIERFDGAGSSLLKPAPTPVSAPADATPADSAPSSAAETATPAPASEEPATPDAPTAPTAPAEPAAPATPASGESPAGAQK